MSLKSGHRSPPLSPLISPPAAAVSGWGPFRITGVQKKLSAHKMNFFLNCLKGNDKNRHITNAVLTVSNRFFANKISLRFVLHIDVRRGKVMLICRESDTFFTASFF